ncbi:MAG: GBS Bsp-like repeat-containing protein [Eubacterium callanderi]|uniref:GBS Bsp-like repeat-containing protein n=2 Tax=Eubacterium callanderi TaxID=53442 RepID=UPI0039938050
MKNSVLGKVKIIGVFLMTFFLLFLCFSSYPISAKVPTIVINPGHLVGRDSGAVNNNNNIQEATLNAELASKVAEKLKDIGYDVFLTHPVTGCSIPALLTTQQVIDGYNSNSSLKTIGDAINSKNPDLAISIHHNSGGNASGYEFYWSSYRAGIDNTDIYKVYGLWGNGDFSWRDKSPCNAALKSKDFAELLKANFSGIGIPFRNIIERDDYIPAHTKCPSVLIEAGFVSNDNESRKLADNTYQNDEANRIVKSIKQLFGEVAVKASGIVTSESSQVNNNVFSVNAEQLKMEGSNISGVSFEVYKNGKIVWYDGIYKSADKFTANVPTKDFNYETGLYGINAYVKDSLGNHYRLGTTFVTVANTKITGKVERLESETTGNSFQIKALDLSPAEQVSGVSYEVYIGDRATWYAGEKQADGSYLGTADIGDFDNIRGEYKINVYGKDQNMVHYKIGETTVQVKKAANTKITGKVERLESETTGNSFQIKALDLSPAEQVSGVSYEVYIGDRATWYAGEKQADGSYLGTADIGDFDNIRGEYKINVYGKDQNMVHYKIGETTVQVKKAANTKITGKVERLESETTGNSFQIKALDLSPAEQVSGVSYEVYIGDRATWYAGEKQADGSYLGTADIGDFDNIRGEYKINVYGKDQNMVHYKIGETTVQVKKAANTKITGKVERLESETTGNSFQIKALDLSPAEQVSGVSYEVYIGDRATWYAGEKQADGSYLGTADIGDFDNIRGEYKINVYGKDQNMVHYKIGETTVQVKNNLTNIMANLHISSNQLVELYNSSGNTFPSYYTENGRNVDLNRFAQLYIEEANAEGIRADVAFAQAMKETGWLKFGGQVSISQFNFAGLGATDDGAAGMSFAQKYGDNENGIRMGIRAQIQHLKAYASTEPLNNACVDERFNLVKRGCAPYVEWLGQKENPNGYGWATGANYGQGIIDIMNRIP